MTIRPDPRILLAYSSYPQSPDDWRSRFIHEYLHAIARNENLNISAWGPSGPIPDNIEYTASKPAQDLLRKIQATGGLAHLARQNPIKLSWYGLRFVLALNKAIKTGDYRLAHIFWLQNGLSLYGTDLPAVISVLGSDVKMLSNRALTRMLKKVLAKRRYVLAPNAGWMIPVLKDALGESTPIQHVPLGINDAFYNIHRQLPDTPRIWLVVLRITEKKMGKLFDWGQNVFNKEDQLHLFGPMQEQVSIPGWAHYHGPTYPDELIKNWMPHASALVTLSEHDEGLPQIIMESMAAGIPVIASNLPAHTSFVEQGKTGYIVESKEEFRNAIESLSDSSHNIEIGKNARAHVLRNIGTWQDCARRYHDIYSQLL